MRFEGHRTARKLAAALHRREDGYTLPELVMAATALIGLVAIMGAGLTTIARNQVRIADRSAQIQQGRTMIERITRELREGSGVQNPTSSSLSFLTYVRRQQCGGSESPTSETTPAIQCRVTYTCSSGVCTRAEALPNGSGSGPAVILVEGLRSNSVFTYAPNATNPGHVTVTLEYPGQDGDETVTLSDGAALRN
jgi:type II secretory pathway pseudopilin PulG